MFNTKIMIHRLKHYCTLRVYPPMRACTREYAIFQEKNTCNVTVSIDELRNWAFLYLDVF